MLDQTSAARVIDKALSLGADFCEIFAEDRRELTLGYALGKCRDASEVNIYGAGIYLLEGTKSVYVYTSDLTEAGLMKLVDKGSVFLGNASAGRSHAFRERPVKDPNHCRIYPSSVPLKNKVKILSDTAAALASAVKSDYHAEYTYFDTDQKVIVAASDGTWAEDRRVTCRLRNRFAVSDGTESTGTFVDFTRPAGFEAFESGEHIGRMIKEVREYEESLGADTAPRGRFPVVFAGGTAVGTFFHEACGHQLESTNLQAKSAYFRDKLGQKVASDKVTVIDDGTLSGQYGSSRYDDEGMPRQKNILIENGVLKSFLTDRLGSRKLGVPRSASGRRQNYTFAPAARMSNTYLAAGSDDPEEMIRDIDFGILVDSIGGGTGGQEFTLSCPRSFLIRNGRVDRLLKRTMLIGRGDETLMKIDRVAGEVTWEDSGSFCGASSGLVNTTTSGAMMRVSEMIIG